MGKMIISAVAICKARKLARAFPVNIKNTYSLVWTTSITGL